MSYKMSDRLQMARIQSEREVLDENIKKVKDTLKNRDINISILTFFETYLNLHPDYSFSQAVKDFTKDIEENEDSSTTLERLIKQ